MVTGIRTAVAPQGSSPEARQRMIREAAYYHYMSRGFEPGHEVEDWLEAEAEIEQAILARQQDEAAFAASGRQQGSTFGAGEDEAFKRMIRHHPQRNISRIEGIEPDEAPPRE